MLSNEQYPMKCIAYDCPWSNKGAPPLCVKLFSRHLLLYPDQRLVVDVQLMLQHGEFMKNNIIKPIYLLLIVIQPLTVIANDLDLNNDGKQDIFYEYGEEFYYELIDNNFDGKIDQSSKYDKNDILVSSNTDDNFDGYLETTSLFKEGSLKYVLVDRHRSGKTDVVFYYDHGVIVKANRFYLGTDGKYKIGEVKFEYYGYPIGKENIVSSNATMAEFILKYVPDK